VLNLDFCTLSSLPTVLGQLTALTTLDVEGNLYLGDSFRSATTPTSAAPMLPAPQPFPVDLAGLQQLRYLNLNSCGLTSIPSVRRYIRLLALGMPPVRDLPVCAVGAWRDAAESEHVCCLLYRCSAHYRTWRRWTWKTTT
jgi:hypothetical protein